MLDAMVGFLIGRVGGKPHNIDVSTGRTYPITVKIIPYGITDKACPDPTVRKPQGSNRLQCLPPQPIAIQNCLENSDLIHSGHF